VVVLTAVVGHACHSSLRELFLTDSWAWARHETELKRFLSATMSVGAAGSFNPGPNWQVKGSGDFNGDGKSDILWQGSDGTPAIWLMDGTHAMSVGAAGSFNPGLDWHVIV
jgi:hypothetical protein